MRKLLLATLFVVATSANADDSSNTISVLNTKSGDPKLADVQVDTAPGTISASSMLSVSGDSVKTIANPRDLTMLLQAFDSSKAFGISLTPARTSLIPIRLSDYASLPIRFAASTTVGYAQATQSVNSADYHERAWSLEASAYLGDDDPLLAWSEALAAGGSKINERGQHAEVGRQQKAACIFAPAVQPAASAGMTGSDEALGVVSKDSKTANDVSVARKNCEDALAKNARWNTSRIWASFASGSYQGAASGSPSHSLGRSIVVGGSYGIGQSFNLVQAQITLGLRRSLKAPVLTTYGDASPQLKNSTLGTFRLAVGRSNLKVLLEGSNVHNQAPDASDRTYKRAFGLDIRLAKGMWANFSVGRQRKIDNSGDETGSSIQLNLSPSSLLSFGS